MLQNLAKIQLSCCILCEEIPILGHLPHLEVVLMVELGNVERIGPEVFVFDDQIVGGSSSNVALPALVVFPALRKLTLCGMSMLKEFKERSDVSSLPRASTSIMEVFLCLKVLCIRDCPNLIIIPDHLLSIQDLHIVSTYAFSGSFKKVCKPSLTIVVDPHSKYTGILLEHVLETSSKSVGIWN